MQNILGDICPLIMPPIALNKFTHMAPLYCTCNKTIHPPIAYLSHLVDIDIIKKIGSWFNQCVYVYLSNIYSVSQSYGLSRYPKANTGLAKHYQTYIKCQHILHLSITKNKTKVTSANLLDLDLDLDLNFYDIFRFCDISV